MKKRNYLKMILLVLLIISPIFLKETSQRNVLFYSAGLVSVPCYGADISSSSSNEGETEVTAHIDPVDTEQTAPPDSSGSALTQRKENKSEESEKTGKPVNTGDLLFEQILLLGIVIILVFAVILLLRLRRQSF